MTDVPQAARVIPYDEVVRTYSLTILEEVGDWSIGDDGDLVMTKDGDFQHGDIAYNGLFRLVQMWRVCEAHLRNLFDAMHGTLAWRVSLDDKMNALGETRRAQFSPTNFLPSPEFSKALNEICDQQASAAFGAGVYAGSLMLMLSGMLLRLRDDIDAKNNWTSAGPLYNGYSVGAIIEAGANGFRHADEWAKTRIPTSQQKRSQIVIEAALSSRPPPDDSSPGGCVELLCLLSGETFDGLAKKVFEFAHELARKQRGWRNRKTRSF
jgi:hypothetical protein